MSKSLFRVSTIIAIAIIGYLVLPAGSLTTQAAAQEKDESDELTLERLFPDDGLFGPSARSMSFSDDGRYGAFLYRPNDERRHGNDLWIYDFQTSKMERITSVSVMAEFQEDARKVRDDRIKKAKESLKESDDDDDDKKELTDDQKNGDWVSDKDADDEKAPRYGGVSSFEWSPSANEMLMVSGGDLYQLSVENTTPVRLTRTEARESSVTYLPDGTGYMYMQDDHLMKVVFGQHFIEQIDPKLPSGEDMSAYTLSPDGTRLALITRKGDAPFSSDRTVNIVSYRTRFAEVRKVSRTVADDPKKEQELFYYFYDLDGNQTESSTLTKIYSTKMKTPRDVVSTPEWAPDSSRVTFAVFTNTNEEVHILKAEFPESASDEDGEEGDAKDASAGDDDDKTEAADGDKDHEAELVYRFLHFGGPNTPRMIRPQFTSDSRKIVLISEQSGFRHVYLLDPLYQSLQQITSGHYEVYPQRMSDDHKWLFVTATRDNAAREEIYRIDLESGEMEKISQDEGNYSSVAVNNDGTRVLANFVTYGTLTELVRIDLKQSDKQKTLTDSHSEEAKKLTEPTPEFFTYENRHGHTIHGMMFKPDGWKKSDNRPMLIYVYGGPLGTRKMVVDGSYASDAYFFAYYMAKKHGYVTVTIDPRGLSGYGGVFEKANFDQIGKPQVEDLVDGTKYMVENYGVDEKRVAIHGWSFGGFQTQMCLYTAPETFQVGIAGAGPTEWENYNAWYTTGTVGLSREGETDQKEYSLLPLAKNLEGKLLLVHGMEDSNVLYQDTVRVYRELLKAGKETLVELFLDPTGGHGLGGDVKRLNRYRKYEEFLLRTLADE